jgi:ADP-ribosyl-[dinitrogen reductase] hydrolase
MLHDLSFRHRALGAVIGSAVGDALGAPFEFGEPCKYSKRFPRPVLGGRGELIGNQVWEPGEFTDDTQMAIVQAESILARGGIDGADLFKRFQVWAADAKDVGAQTRAVLGSDLPWNESARSYYQRNPNRSAGNGSLMRATPTAVRFAAASAEQTFDAARHTSTVTHSDPAAAWGTALFHLMIRAALRGQDPFAALDAALCDLPSDQARYREMLDVRWQPANTSLNPRGFAPRTPRHALSRAASTARSDRVARSHGSLASWSERQVYETASNLPNGTVWTCLAQAVWAVRTNADSFADAVTSAIDLGGDTDTVAAVAGALAGASVGIQGIPIRWMTYVHGYITTPEGRRTYRAHDLQDLTMRLLGSTGAPEASLGRREGPTEIETGVFAADLGAASGVDRDWAVLSLCRVGGCFSDHSIRREVFLLDDDNNPGLASVVEDCVSTIDAWRAEGRTVVVHCQGGASRTGLILRAWLMRKHGWSSARATERLKSRWPCLGEWNESFTTFLRDRWS